MYTQPPASQDIWKVQRPSPNDPEEQKIAKELRDRVTQWQTADAEFLKNADIEQDFLAGNHWRDEANGQDKGQALRDIGRSAFTIDLLSPSVDLVVNQIRINKLTANFIPMGGSATKATAQVRQGLYRNIDRVSNAAIARETAYQMAVSVGRGYERVLIEDEDGPTFLKKITIQRVDNLHSIAIDPTVLDFTYADAGWGYAFDDLWKEEFVETYRVDPDTFLDINGIGLSDDQRALWFPKDKVRVGEYFRKKWRRREVWRLTDGRECWKEDAPPGSRPTDIKSKMDYVLEWRKMTGTQVIEKRIWPGKYVPIVVYIGREVFRGQKPKIHSGMVRPAMAPSQIFDYMESRKVDEVGLAPLPHFMAYTGQLSPEQKRIVNEINRHPWSVVELTAVEDSEGRQLQCAGWVSPSPNTAAVVQAADSAKDNLERVLNTYAPQRGAQVGDSSGKAISAIKDSGDISHAGFPDNFNRALQHEAAIVNELMDFVYTDKQALTITLPDDRTLQVLINQEYEDKKTGQKITHLFGGDAKYGVSAVTGPSYPNRASEALQKLLDLAKIFPNQLASCVDLIVDLLDVPDDEKLIERLRPPNFHDDENGPSMQQVQQSLTESQQQLQQADAIIQHLMEIVKKATDSNQIKMFEILSKLKIAAASDRAGIIEAQVRAGEDTAAQAFLMELKHILSQMENQGNPEESNETRASAPEAAPATASGGPLDAASSGNGAPAPPSTLPPVGPTPGGSTQ